MRKIILILAAGVFSLTGVLAQSIELTPSGYSGEHESGDNIDLKTSNVPVLNMYIFGGTLTSPTAVPGAFTIMRLGGGGYDGTAYRSLSARLDFRTTSDWSASNRGTFMRFITTPDGSTSSIEGMRLTDNGRLGVGLSNPGTTFEVSSTTGGNGINISKEGSGFGSARLSLWSDRNTVNEWRPGYIESDDDGIFTGRLDFFTNGTGSLAKTAFKKGMSLSNGKVMIGDGATGTSNGLFDFALHVASNGVGSAVNGTGGLVGLGAINSVHTVFGNTSIDTWFGATGRALNLNFFSKGTVTIGSVGEGNLQVEGYTQMGDDFNAPKIKMNTFYGSTTGSSSVNITHNIADANKILSVNAMILSTTNAHYYPPNGVSSVFHQYSYRVSSSQIKLEDIGSSLQSSTYKVTITYED